MSTSSEVDRKLDSFLHFTIVDSENALVDE
jgi:hypothetical protein